VGARQWSSATGVDYFKVDSAGHTFKGDSTKKADYYGYGQDVLAVADAVVAVASDAVPENDVPHPSKRACRSISAPSAGTTSCSTSARDGTSSTLTSSRAVSA
jgi:hypothetical protein